MAHRRARATPPKATMNPSPWTLISPPTVTSNGVAHDAVVLAQDLAGGLVAEPFGHAGVVDHVAEQDGHGAIGGETPVWCRALALRWSRRCPWRCVCSWRRMSLAERRQVGGVADGVHGTEDALGGRPRDLLARAVGTALDVDAPHDREAAHHDPGRARDDGHVAQLEAAAAHEREAPQLHVEPLGDDDVDAAPEGHRGDLDLRALDLGPAQVHVAAAHDGHGVRLPADAPAALRAVAAHDRDVPAALSCAGSRRARAASPGQVRHDGLEVAPGPGLEGQPDPLRELVERQPALDDVLAQLCHGAVTIGVGHTLGRVPRRRRRAGARPREPAGPP